MLLHCIYMCIYLMTVSVFSYEIARHESFVGIRISKKMQHRLLIFGSKLEKISIICIISQVYAFIMIGIFVVSRFIYPLKFLYSHYNNMFDFHLWVIIPIGMLEVGLRWLVKYLTLY